MGPNRRLMNRRRTNILILGRKGMGGGDLTGMHTVCMPLFTEHGCGCV